VEKLLCYSNLTSSGSSGGEVTRCLVWGGELVDTGKMNEQVGSTYMLYLRLAGLDAAHGMVPI
jgi:hypothetical protein